MYRCIASYSMYFKADKVMFKEIKIRENFAKYFFNITLIIQ